MALQQSHIQFGITFAEAYFMVTDATVSNLNKATAIQVSIWSTSAARTANKKTVGWQTYYVSDPEFTTRFVDGVNAVQASYNYLKTLPAFSSATDV